MVKWKINVEEVILHEHLIYSLYGNFLKNNKQFREIRPDKKGHCELCDTPFEDNEQMTLALNEGKDGNLLICAGCKDQAIEFGVPCTYRKEV